MRAHGHTHTHTVVRKAMKDWNVGKSFVLVFEVRFCVIQNSCLTISYNKAPKHACVSDPYAEAEAAGLLELSLCGMGLDN